MKAISLFSGAMGLDLGIEEAGFDVLACIENDSNCVKTIKANKPSVRIYPEDINTIAPQQVLDDLGEKVGSIDLVLGGPPCQPFSTAGRRKGLNDFRGNVIIRFLEYVKVIEPNYFILENVRGLYYAKLNSIPDEYAEYGDLVEIKGSVLYFLFTEFEKLGYKVSFNLFDSSLYDVPQKRERMIMFGAKNGSPVNIPEPYTPNRNKTLKDAIDDIQNTNHDHIELRDKQKKYMRHIGEGQYWKHLPEKLQKEAMGKSYNLSGGRTGFYRRLSWDAPSPTLVTHPTMPATMLVHPSELRPLSVQEYARIQQFPDDWQFQGSITSQYKQIGNAVPVGLGKMAGETLIKHIQGNDGDDYIGSTSRYKGTHYKEFIAEFRENHINQDKQF